MWQSFLAIARKEFTHALRDRTLLRMLIITQCMQLVMLGFIDLNVRDLPTVLVDQDHSAQSRELAHKIEATGLLRFKYLTSSIDQARGHLRAGRASVAVVIPPDFHRDRASGGRARVLTMVDGSEAAVTAQAVSAVDGVVVHMNLLAQHESEGPTISTHSITLFNPQGRTANFMLPGLIAVALQVLYMNQAAMALVREREFGNLERLLMTPVNFTALMLGKVAPYVLLAIVNGFINVFIIRFVFGVPIRGDVGVLALAISLYVITVCSLGIFLASAAPTMREVGGRTVLLQLPTFLLSGYVLPVESIPSWLRPIAYALPATHMIKIMRGVTIRGAGFADLALHLGFLTLAPLLLIGTAVRRFRRSVLE